MVNLEQAQKILDHFHKGKIQKLEYRVYYYEVRTSKGIFYILQDDPLIARGTELERRQKLETLVGKTNRLLLPDNKGKLQEFSSYAHLQGIFYSVYKKPDEE